MLYKLFCIVGQVAKTLPFHGSNIGSIPIRCMKCYFLQAIF